MTPRAWAAITLAVLLVAVVVVAALRVPWSAPPAPRADQLAALDTLPADAVAKGRAFHAALRPGTYLSLALGLLVALLLGLTPAGAWIVEQVSRPFGGHWLARALLGGLAVVFIGEVAALPLAAWRQSILRRYGLSTQDWSGWTVDMLKGYAVGAVIGAIALVGFFTITHFAPRWWWAWGAAGAALLTVLLSFVFPVLVEPVFNKFTPMAEGEQRTRLIALAERDGVPVRDVLVADASRRTRAVNAYVSGLGPTRRIVVYDTLLEKAPPEEVESVVAHELGHAKDGDVLTGTLLGAFGAAAAVCGLYLLGSWGALLRRAGVDTIGEPRAVALLVAVATVAGLLAGPAQAFVSRRVEARADRHALRLTDDPAGFEAMQGRLSLVNLGDPDPNPVEQFLFGSHPTAVQRMAEARAWARGER
ncbi:M48 family metallopeptidase [Dactylosporangium aurantiacum]|uniref:M48 family metallopeptidase n=1 Tax=Dactylosporangium aurantiacum TaxID=35754 RepID=A0A9Q9IBA2_9ACTN|nr:M48 family metallopeptidase [Dactylosporangium aurantiacum]MDG6102433.1 M48 family metallopeptidase [Dactylosporangium aurantiacum]UWZ53279.1 M48 family metallopeptidase [Dactylosporangium aurantiacum]